MNKVYDPDNIFAKLLRNEIPSVRVYEDDTAVAFMDVMPQGMGHTLVVPRAGSLNLLDAKPEALAESIKVVQKVAKAVKKALNADGITILQFNEPAGGQTVFHLHFHVIPRFDGVELKEHTGAAVDTNTLEQIAAKIRAAF